MLYLKGREEEGAKENRLLCFSIVIFSPCHSLKTLCSRFSGRYPDIRDSKKKREFKKVYKRPLALSELIFDFVCNLHLHLDESDA